MADYDPTALLSTPLDGIKAPVGLPNGTYMWLITKREFGKSSEKKTDFVKFTMVPLEPSPDVDEDLLAAATENKALTEREKTHDFYLTPDALFMLKEFGREAVGVSEDDAKTVSELIEQCLQRKVMGTLVPVQNKKNPDRPYQNFGSFARVPE